MKDRAMEIATWAVELQNKVAKLEAVNTALLEACKEFVRKVDCGQARSTRSYMQMKAAIAKAEEVIT
jgi:hypothetical protein